MDIELLSGVSAVFLIIGLVYILTEVFNLEKKYAPVAAVVLGLIVSFGFQFYANTEIYTAIIRGITVGLSAVGLYSGTKNVREGIGGE